nr:PREDICTED: proprotein convertase subtilisin/kexin type 5-like [Latimeria chalumnae]|eukprot:XP_005987835.1 PREDICTED: proprotein convertase subtilisin/kexin type 5-like [Latimeria chalumnae]
MGLEVSQTLFLILSFGCFNVTGKLFALSCPSGQFALNYQCIDCHPSCEECNGQELFECTKCGIDEEGSERFLYLGRCKLHCPRGFYQDHKKHSCEACMANCDLCTGTETCAKCKGNYKLQNGVCQITQCEEGQVENPENGECLDCDSGCKTCSADDPELCSSCLEGYFLYRYQCRRRCPQKYYEDRGRRMCLACPLSCVECKNESYCLSCVGYYLYVADNKCYRCDATCQTCFGPQALDCSSCYSGYFLDQDSSCVEHCPLGFFSNPATQLCEQCSFTCESCKGKSENCLRCKNEDYSLFLFEGRCVFSCPDGYFGSADGLCEKCDRSCQTCDESKTKCSTCIKGLYLENDQCLSECSVGYYPDEDGTCKHCSAHCNICDGSKTCKVCSYMYLLHNGICKATCPEGYFEDLDRQRCLLCHMTCATCSGTSNNDCETCSPDTPKLYKGQCLEECLSGTFYESKPEECQECDRTCAKCSGPLPTDCIMCKEELALDPVTKRCGVKGDAKCPPKTFLHSNHFTCEACYDGCESCTGSSQNDCLTCRSPYYLYRIHRISKRNFLKFSIMKHRRGKFNYNNTCMKECPPGTYHFREEADGVELGFCSNCDQVCSTCTGGSPQDCITCTSGYYKIQHYCILHCPVGYYKGTNHCEKCDAACQHCLGSGPQACLVCPPHTLQIEDSTQCVEHCPERFYQDNQVCKQCHQSCKTCKDSTPRGCLTCDWGNTLQDSICYPHCEEKHYLTEEEVCKSCHPSCRHCSGPGPNSCVTCKLNYALHPIEKNCKKCCSPETDQPDCCLCSSNTGLCAEQLQSWDKKLMQLNTGYKRPSLSSAIALGLVMVVLVIGIGIFGLLQAKARKKLCWRQSYEWLGGNSKAAPFVNTDYVVLNKSDHANEHTHEECDVVYSSKDGTVYRRYGFKLSEDEEDEEECDEKTRLNKVNC